jgi:uncharacterized protein YcnI
MPFPYRRLRRLACAVAAAVACSAIAAAVAEAHARVSPPVIQRGEGQVLTLAVPTEKEGPTTTSVTLTPPPGFSIDSFAPTPGWKRTAVTRGSGEEQTVERVTWSGGSVPHGEYASFEFLGSGDSSKTYTFDVQQVYSDGSVVNWTGPESSDTPAPAIDAVSSLGGGRTPVVSIVAVALAGAALLVGVVALAARRGRPLA